MQKLGQACLSGGAFIRSFVGQESEPEELGTYENAKQTQYMVSKADDLFIFQIEFAVDFIQSGEQMRISLARWGGEKLESPALISGFPASLDQLIEMKRL